MNFRLRGNDIFMTALFFGMLHGWSISNPWNGHAVWWLQLVAMVWLVRALFRTASPKAAFTLGGLFAVAWFTSSLWWIYTSMHTYGGLAAPLAALAVLALSIFLASFYAFACSTFVLLKRGSSLFDATLFTALWLLAELARATLFTGFPWSATGYAHIDSPLISAAPWVGVYGLSALAALIAALFVLTRSCGLKILIVLVLSIKAYMMPSPQAISDKPSQSLSATSLTVRLLQGNIPQNEKFDAKTGVALALAWYQERLLAAAKDGVDLVVTPETGVPLLPQQLPLGYWSKISDAFTQQSKTAALIGIPLGTMREGYTNSVIGLNSAATPYRYDKHHLVPFGEFIPPFFRWFTNLMNIPLGDFNRGGLAQPSFAHAGQRFAVNICFEDLFGEELAKRFADKTTAPTIFVNVSNMGWFGSGIAIDEHVNISRMRAIEFDRPILRATNTGATVVIDHKGVVTQSLARSTRGMLNAHLSGEMLSRTSLTPYALWAFQYGLKPLWIVACGLITLAFLRRKSRFPPSRE
jgi:apolipoprotein N-acyltransferase